MQWELIKLRKENKDTQGDLAAFLGLSITGYRNKEHGITQFDSDEMFMISRRYNKPIEDIFLPREYAKRVQEKRKKEVK